MISCSSGIELSCAEGLSFDYSSQQCIYQIDCNPTSATTTETTITSATTTVAPITTTPTTTPTTTTTITTSMQDAVYLVCTPNGKIFYPHPTDCNKLIKCELIENTDQYTTIIQTCPGGTMFNPDLQVCDWPHNVICKTYTYDTQAATTKTESAALVINGKFAKF